MRKFRLSISGILALAIVLPGPALADDALVRGLIGLGAAIIINESQKRHNNQYSTQQRRSAATREAREEQAKRKALRAEVQRRLNALGFDAGKPDGVYGRNTRRAIAAFQQSIGHAASGTISEEEVATLYDRSAGLPTDGGGFAAYSQPDGEQGSFPALGAPGQGGQSAPGSFPVLGKQPAGGEPGSSMPGLAAAPSAAEPQMPGVAGAPSAAEPQLPGIGAGAPDGATASEGPSLATELARTAYGAEAPAVAGVKLGQSAEAAIGILAEAGFTGCDPAVAPVACSRSTDLLNDEVALWADAEQGNWAIVRSMTFNTPVPADMILNQFLSTYPELMGTPARMISSGQFCTAAQMSASDLRSTVTSIASAYQNPDAVVPSPIGDFASRCPLVFAVNLQGGELVEAATITFVDATGISRLITEQRVRLTGDLKL